MIDHRPRLGVVDDRAASEASLAAVAATAAAVGLATALDRKREQHDVGEGLVGVEGGTVEIDGREVTNLPTYRRARLGVGYLPQEVSIFRGLTVEDNIMAILEINEPDTHRRRERLEELLSEFSIGHLRRAQALALSGGERRRVEIARCLAADPKYLLLDEPFAGVDPIAVGEIRHLVADLKNRGIGVLITDHNVRETLEIVDRAYILHDGKVLMSGTTEEVVQDENVRRVYLGQSFRIS